MAVQDRISSLRDKGVVELRDWLELGGSLVVFLLSAAFVTDMFIRWWAKGGVTKGFVAGVFPEFGVPAVVVYVALAGFFVGLFGTFLFDSYRRGKGVLLFAFGLFPAAIFLVLEGVFLDVVAAQANGFVFLSLGGSVLAGLWYGGMRRDEWTALYEGDRVVIENVVDRVWWAVAVVLGVVFAEAHLRYRSPFQVVDDGFVARQVYFYGFDFGAILQDIAVIGVLLFSLKRFANFEANKKVMMMGPARSGKTAAFGGMKAAVEDVIDSAAMTETPGTTVSRINSARDSIKDGRWPDPTEKGDDEKLQFAYKYTPGLFPKQFEFETYDYPGERLNDICQYLLEDEESAGRADGFQRDTEPISVGDTDSDDDDSEDAREADPDEAVTDGGAVRSATRDGLAERVEDQIEQSDTLLFTIPIDDFLGPVVERGNHREYLELEYIAPQTNQPDGRFDESVPNVVAISDIGDEIQNEIGCIPPGTETGWLRWERSGRMYPEYPPSHRTEDKGYLQYYRDLARTYSDKQCFVVATKADHIWNDYQEASVEEDQSFPIAVDDEYDPFAAHTSQEVLGAESAVINDLLNHTENEGTVYPTWYFIDSDRHNDEGKPLIKTRNIPKTIFQGSIQLLKRIHG